MANPSTIPFGSKPLASIPFGSKPIAPINTGATPSTPVGTQAQSSLASNLFDFGKGVVDKTLQTYQDVIKSIPQDIQAGAADIQKGGIGNITKGLLKGSLRPTADIAGAVFAPVGAVIGQATETSGLQKGLNAISKYIVDKSGVTDQPWFQQFATQHPNAEQDFGRALNLIMAAGDKGEINPQRVINELKIGSGNAVEAIKNHIEQSSAMREAQSGVKQVEQAKTLTGKILQTTTPQETTLGQNALQAVDLQGVKNYGDLASRFQVKSDANTAKVDIALSKNPTEFQADQLIHTNPQNVDFVSKALTQLKDYYSKTEDAPSLAEIEKIQAKYNDSGLTPKEINDLARIHGRDLNAYNASGQLASGLSKQAAENVRNGLKETSRYLMPDENTRAIDKETSNLIKAKELATEMESKVQTLQNRFQKAGLLAKSAGFVGKVVDLFSGGVLKGAFRGITGLGSVKGSTLNALDIQSALQKNIKLFSELEKLDPKQAYAKLEELTKNKQPGLVDKAGSFMKGKMGLTIEDVSKSSPLVQEAQKYKSAEEFVRAQESIYHGTYSKIGLDELKPTLHKESFGRGISFSRDKGIAETFAGYNNPNVIEAKNSGLKLYKLTPEEQVFRKISPQRAKELGLLKKDGKPIAISQLKNYGYDGIDFGNADTGKQAVDLWYQYDRGLDYNKNPTSKLGFTREDLPASVPSTESEVFVFDTATDKLKATKSQLTDIWNKAHSK